MAPSARSTSPVREAESLAERLGSVVLRLSRGLRVEGARLSSPMLSALAAVARSGSIRIGELAAAEGVEAPTMSRLIDRLELEGLVRRRRDPSDSRGVAVEPTSRTARALASARRARQGPLAAHLSSLSPAERAQLAAALRVLEKLVRTLDII